MSILAIGLISMNNWQRPDGNRQDRLWAVAGTDGSGTDTLPAAPTITKVRFPSISNSTDIDGATKTGKVRATDAEGNTFPELTKVNGEITGNGHQR